MYLGNFAVGDTIDLKFTTVTTTGAPTTLAGTPAISVYKSNSTAQSTTGVTLTADFDSVTGLNHVRITTGSDGTFYAGANDFQVIITTGTVGGTSVVGYLVASFSLTNRVANVTAIDGQATSGNNATLNLKQLNVSNSGGDAIVAASTGSNGNGINASGNGTGSGVKGTGGATGRGIYAVGGATSGAGIRAEGTNNAPGLLGVGQGTGAGIEADGGASGPGEKWVGGATSGAGLSITTTSGDGISVAPTAGHGMNLAANGTSKHGLLATGGTAGTSDGIKGAAGTGGTDIRGIVADVSVTTRAEPGQGVPAATSTLASKVDYLFKFLRNRTTQTATTLKVYADDATTVDHKATVSDDSTTFDRGEIASGP